MRNKKPMTIPLALEEPVYTNGNANRLFEQDRAVHDWYRFVLSFPAHLVRDYLGRWEIGNGQRVLDPFCGTGTTIVEAKKRGIEAVGIEANSVVHFAASTKTDWTPEPEDLVRHAERIAAVAAKDVSLDIPDALLAFAPEAEKLLLTDSLSPIPAHKVLALRNAIEEERDDRFYAHERLALARVAVATASNLRFGPEVGVAPRKKQDAPVMQAWLQAIREMAADLRFLSPQANAPSCILHGDARCAASLIAPCSIDAVFTSPPYPNEKDYSRTTRLEMVLLGYATNKAELQLIKKGLLRSNTRNVYKGDDDDLWAAQYPAIQEIAEEIEQRRIAMGKTSGFERLYARVTRLYFGGMARHLAELRPLLRPGAHLAYVVGDQASYLRVMIRTGELLAEIAESLGYERVSIDLFRTRLATATREMMREEVVVLRWPGFAGTETSSC